MSRFLRKRANVFNKFTTMSRYSYMSLRRNSSDTQEMKYDLDNVYKGYRLDGAPEMSGTLKKTEALAIYYKLALIRKLETALQTLYRSKTIRGFCHLYIGQEACAVGQNSAMTDEDCIITSYRCHGWAYLSGLSAEDIILELTGKKAGVCRGKGGSMHLYAPNFFGGNGIVGAQVPLGGGIALALQYLNKKAVCIALYGDGAANQGQIFETINMACLWKLPCLIVCENNRYGMGTKVNRSSCNIQYFTRGDVVPGIWVDGQNVLAVRNATAFARKHALEKGPIVMELDTYRFSGHSMSDPGTSYRTRDEVSKMRQSRDPLKIFREICMKGSLVSEKEFDSIDDVAKKEIDDIVKKINTSPEPEDRDLHADIWYMSLEPRIRGAVSGKWFDHVNISKRPEYKPKPTPDSEINKGGMDTKTKSSNAPPAAKKSPSSGSPTKSELLYQENSDANSAFETPCTQSNEMQQYARKIA